MELARPTVDEHCAEECPDSKDAHNVKQFRFHRFIHSFSYDVCNSGLNFPDGQALFFASRRPCFAEHVRIVSTAKRADAALIRPTMALVFLVFLAGQFAPDEAKRAVLIRGLEYAIAIAKHKPHIL
jgi:hypothetical protein